MGHNPWVENHRIRTLVSSYVISGLKDLSDLHAIRMVAVETVRVVEITRVSRSSTWDWLNRILTLSGQPHSKGLRLQSHSQFVTQHPNAKGHWN